MRILNSLIVPKNLKGGPFGIFNIPSVAKFKKLNFLLGISKILCRTNHVLGLYQVYQRKKPHYCYRKSEFGNMHEYCLKKKHFLKGNIIFRKWYQISRKLNPPI